MLAEESWVGREPEERCPRPNGGDGAPDRRVSFREQLIHLFSKYR